MIGLGSNRLTVCRRGGMSVTQAGRGGMEWLAGVRDPSWASPYSAQATAYLKQNYGDYWSEIMAYGFDPAHAALIPYINEDPDLVCSLMDVGKERWIIGANDSRVDITGFREGSLDVDTTFQFTTLNNNVCGLWGENETGKDSSFQWSGAYYLNGSNLFSGLAIDTTYRLTHIGTAWKVYKNGEEWKSGTKAKAGTLDCDLMLFGLTNNQGTQTYPGPHRFKNYVRGNVLNLVPCKHKVSGVEKVGFLNVIDQAFYPDQGSGTISESPAS